MKIKLTAEEREKLQKTHKKEKERRKADRIKTILLLDWSYEKIAEALFLTGIFAEQRKSFI